MRFNDLRGVQSVSIQDDERRQNDELLSIADVISFFKHFWPSIASTAAVCLILGLLYVLTATPTYTAVAQLLIETNQPAGPTITTTPEAAVALDTPQIESQIAVLNSEQIIERAVKALDASTDGKAAKDKTAAPNAAEKPATSPAAGQRGWLSHLFFGNPPPETQAEEAKKMRQQVNAIQDNLSIKRVGLSYVLELSYRDTNPKVAAAVVNALGDAYVQDKIDGRTEAARRSSLWLEARIEEIRRLMNEAALDVQEFKARRDYRLADRPAPSDRDLGLDFLPKPTTPDTGTKKDSPTSNDDRRLANASEAPTLEELDSRALTYRKIYESYLQAYTDTVQRQSFPGTASRVISRAEPPKRQSSPKRGLTLVASIVFGSFLGIGIALVRTALDETVRSSNQLMRKIGAPLLGEIEDTPYLARLPLIGKAFRRRERQGSNAFIALRQPHSPIARQIVMTAAEINGAAHQNATPVIGILGITKNVDDAAVCSNIALVNALAGKKTLLVEAATGRLNLTTSYAPDLHFDLKDVIDAGVTPADAVVQYSGERALSLLFLGNSETDSFWTPERIDKLRATINELRGQYDSIFVHLPPASVGDLTTRAVDGALVVSELWGTKVSELEEVASRMRIAEQPLLGIVTANFS
ncbi:MAG: hypothetical protein JSR78_20480 [Proteobacteria bacterium]|nr:hypothetical protein [Pseudomonadota bacterium]